jgi:hypothetical protein
MKRNSSLRLTLGTTALLLITTQPGLSETCQEKFVRLMIYGNGDSPVKIQVVSKMKGGSTSKNNFYQVKTGHWMTEMVEPESPWTLAHNNKMYVSADKGKSWKKIRDMDSKKNFDQNIKNQKENSKTVKNATCGEEEYEGVMHDIVEADFNTLQNFKTQNHHKYWINKKTGYASKATYDIKGKGFNSFISQTTEPAPELKLPTPE